MLRRIWDQQPKYISINKVPKAYSSHGAHPLCPYVSRSRQDGQFNPNFSRAEPSRFDITDLRALLDQSEHERPRSMLIKTNILQYDFPQRCSAGLNRTFFSHARTLMGCRNRWKLEFHESLASVSLDEKNNTGESR